MAIREYIYLCHNCNYEFSEFVNWEDAGNYHPKCNMCKSNKHVYREYSSERVSFVDNTPKTIGALADKNSEKRLKEGRSLEQEKTDAQSSIIKEKFNAQKKAN